MAESITVNGVVFKYIGDESPSSAGVPIWRGYSNGNTRLVNDPVLGDYYAIVAGYSAGWRNTAEEALAAVSREANYWAPVLRELDRINGGAV